MSAPPPPPSSLKTSSPPSPSTLPSCSPVADTHTANKAPITSVRVPSSPKKTSSHMRRVRMRMEEKMQRKMRERREKGLREETEKEKEGAIETTVTIQPATELGKKKTTLNNSAAKVKEEGAVEAYSSGRGATKLGKRLLRTTNKRTRPHQPRPQQPHLQQLHVQPESSQQERPGEQAAPEPDKDELPLQPEQHGTLSPVVKACMGEEGREGKEGQEGKDGKDGRDERKGISKAPTGSQPETSYIVDSNIASISPSSHASRSPHTSPILLPSPSPSPSLASFQTSLSQTLSSSRQTQTPPQTPSQAPSVPSPVSYFGYHAGNSACRMGVRANTALLTPSKLACPESATCPPPGAHAEGGVSQVHRDSPRGRDREGGKSFEKGRHHKQSCGSIPDKAQRSSARQHHTQHQLYDRHQHQLGSNPAVSVGPRGAPPAISQRSLFQQFQHTIHASAYAACLYVNLVEARGLAVRNTILGEQPRSRVMACTYARLNACTLPCRTLYTHMLPRTHGRTYKQPQPHTYTCTRACRPQSPLHTLVY